MKRETIQFQCMDKQHRIIKGTCDITDGGILWKFENARIAKEMFIEESKTNKNIKYFERLAAFGENHDGKELEELKEIIIKKFDSMGIKDWTNKTADKIKKMQNEHKS